MDGNTEGTGTSATPAIMPSHQLTSVSTGERLQHEIMQSFNCALCSTSFNNSVDQRTHMKNAWHIYNLKRRITSLPPLSQSIFKSRVETAKLHEVECPTCQETFATPKEYQTHLKSRDHVQQTYNTTHEEHLSDSEDDGIGIEHLAKVASQIETLKLRDSDHTESESERHYESDFQSSDDGENNDDGFNETNCLFCSHESENLDMSIDHMENTHMFFIPNPSGLQDIASFLSYLHTLISTFHECISCACVLPTADAARMHMRDGGHCRVDAGDEEFREFWEEEDDSVGKGKDKLRVEDEKLPTSSGKILRNRAHARRRREAVNTQSLTAEKSTDSQTESAGQQQTSNSTPETADESTNQEKVIVLGRRNEMGLVGLSDPERRALRATEKKILRVEMRSRKKFRAGLDRQGEKANVYGLRRRARHVGDHVMDWK